MDQTRRRGGLLIEGGLSSTNFDDEYERVPEEALVDTPKKSSPYLVLLTILFMLVVGGGVLMVHHCEQGEKNPRGQNSSTQPTDADTTVVDILSSGFEPAAIKLSPLQRPTQVVPEPKEKISRSKIPQQNPSLQETFISDGALATASVRGNLGPPSVVVSPVADDWLNDRWQAAKNMKGEPIPGPHWIVLALKEPAHNISKIKIDFETAYSNDYAVDAYCSDTQSWETVYKSSMRDVVVQRFKHHVTHEICLKGRINVCEAQTIDQSSPSKSVSKVRLRIKRPAERWGTSVWSFLVWGYG